MNYVLDAEPISERIIVRLLGYAETTSIIGFYAPSATTEMSEVERQGLYEKS